MSEAKDECASVKTALLTANTSGAVCCEAQSERVRERGSKKVAFTLAEVLITIGIIGVVAAMTIPTLMTKIHHKQYTARLKKFYSTMKQLNISAEEEFGDISGWEMVSGADGAEEFLKKYFTPFLKGNIVRNGTSVFFEFLDGSRFAIGKGDCMDIVYDVNGYSNPNKLGYDRFRFLYCSASSHYFGTGKGGFSVARTVGTDMKNRASLLDMCKNFDTRPGSYCTALLLHDNWEFKDDYPFK